jgi:hypothetical protein
MGGVMNEHCDRCGAQAKSRFVMNNGFDLYFCGHHAREYKDGLDKVSYEDVVFSENELVTV